jgi:hypothetical protein
LKIAEALRRIREFTNGILMTEQQINELLNRVKLKGLDPGKDSTTK